MNYNSYYKAQFSKIRGYKIYLDKSKKLHNYSKISTSGEDETLALCWMVMIGLALGLRAVTMVRIPNSSR